MSALLAAAVRLGESAGSTALRESIWMYPLIETAHVLAICLFVGFAVLLSGSSVWDPGSGI